MKVGIVGSRGFTDYQMVCDEMSLIDNVDVIVSGGARGADSLGEKWAKENNKETLIFKPDWNKFGKRAGFIRNEDIIKNSDYVIAFWDGMSKGTKSSIDLCKKFGIKLKIVKY